MLKKTPPYNKYRLRCPVTEQDFTKYINKGWANIGKYEEKIPIGLCVLGKVIHQPFILVKPKNKLFRWVSLIIPVAIAICLKLFK